MMTSGESVVNVQTKEAKKNIVSFLPLYPLLICIQQKSFISSFMNAYMAEKRRRKTFPSFFLVSYLLMQMLWWWWWSGWHFMKIECPLIHFVDCLPSFPTYFNAVEYIYLEMASQGKKYSKYFFITNMHTIRKNWRWMYNENVLCACRHSFSISVFSPFLLCIRKKYYLEDAAAIPTMLLTVLPGLTLFLWFLAGPAIFNEFIFLLFKQRI